MLKLRRNLDLPAKTLAVHARAQLRRQNLDYYSSAEISVGRDENAAHAAARKLPLDLVRVRKRVFETLFESAHFVWRGILGEVTAEFTIEIDTSNRVQVHFWQRSAASLIFFPLCQLRLYGIRR